MTLTKDDTAAVSSVFKKETTKLHPRLGHIHVMPPTVKDPLSLRTLQYWVDPYSLSR